MWKKWDENVWYNTNNGDLVTLANPSTDDSPYWVSLFTQLGKPDRKFNTEAEARAFIEEFIK